MPKSPMIIPIHRTRNQIIEGVCWFRCGNDVIKVTTKNPPGNQTRRVIKQPNQNKKMCYETKFDTTKIGKFTMVLQRKTQLPKY